jgi:hypothetical protein
MSERELGPFVVIPGTADHRRWPKFGRSNVSDQDGTYHPGCWVSWRGRQLLVARSKWWLRKATWRNQLVCRVTGKHPEVRVVTKGGLRGATPDTAEVLILEDRIDCGRCGITVRGPQWVNR